MAKTHVHRLGDLQLKIMKILWERPASVSEVHEALRAERLAYTTVATMLRKMEARGLVTHEEADRRFIYRPAVAADVVTRNMADDILERLFEGSLASMVSHLLETREVSRDELSELERLISRRKRQSP